MDSAIKGLFEEWQYGRNIIRWFIEELDDSDLDKELPRENLNTIRKQCEELLEVQACYVEGIETGVIEFGDYKDETMPGNTSDQKLLERCEKLDSQLESKLEEIEGDVTVEWFGQDKTIHYHLSAMISHESMHIGQIVAFCYATGITIPEKIANIMALSH